MWLLGREPLVLWVFADEALAVLCTHQAVEQLLFLPGKPGTGWAGRRPWPVGLGCTRRGVVLSSLFSHWSNEREEVFFWGGC